MHRPATFVPAQRGGLLLLLFLLLALPAAGAPTAPEPFYRDGELLVRFSPEARGARMAPHAARGLQVQRRLARDVELVRLPPGLSVEEALARYRADPLVEHVEPNYLVRRAVVTANDTHFDKQWHLPAIAAPAAWGYHKGSHAVIVAVLDSGVDYAHADLAGNVCPGLHRCRARSQSGWNFIADSSDPMDDSSDSHGTHVAGLIGAVGNNALGVAGVSWQVHLMPLKFLDARGNGSLADMVVAIDYAVEEGAHIINASFTIPAHCSQTPSAFGQEAVAHAAAQGVLLVAAAGNAGCDNDRTPFYPASLPLPNVIAVAASDAHDRLANFSNFGRDSVHLAAPGTQMLSTLTDNRYGYMQGTSMAAPLVSGALALLQAHCEALGDRCPYPTPQARREALLQSVQPVAGLEGKLFTGGRLDLARALRFDPASARPLPPNHLRGRRLANHEIELEWVANSVAGKPYQLERRRPGGEFESVGEPAADAVRFGDSLRLDARPGTRWEYRLRAGNANGWSDWSVLADVVVPLPPPPELRAWFDAGRGVRLSWRYEESLHDGFEVQRAAVGGSWDVIARVRAPEYLDTGLGATGEYRYRVRALSAEVGPSLPSGTAAVTVTSLAFAGGSGGKCVLSRLLAGSPRGDALLATLRGARDRYLQPNPVGRYVVRAYYRVGTPLVAWLDRWAGLRERLN